MDPILRDRVIAPDGSRFGFCDQLCLSRWMAGTNTTLDEVTHVDAPVEVKRFCVHCAWCGQATSIPTTCVFHESGCPEFDVLPTAIAQKVVKVLRDKRGGRELPDRAFAYLEQHAAFLHESGQQLTFRGLLDFMTDVHVDWE